MSPEGLRADGRRATEYRRLGVRLGASAWSTNQGGIHASKIGLDGSAYYEQGNTKVLAYVVGPREARFFNKVATSSVQESERAIVTCEYSTASFSFSERKQVSKGDRRSTELASLLRQTFESVILTSLYPNSHISLYVQILQNDGAAFTASINALSLALQNAGIPMRDMICACTVGLHDTTPILDLNFTERSNDTPEIAVASMVHSGKIVMIQEENKMNLTYLPKMIELALEGNKQIYQVLKQETKAYSEAILRSRGMINA